jgi:hypothetical protein
MQGDAWHGTVNGYVNHGCRDQCYKAVWADYYRDKRADERQQMTAQGMRRVAGLWVKATKA